MSENDADVPRGRRTECEVASHEAELTKVRLVREKGTAARTTTERKRESRWIRDSERDERKSARDDRYPRER